MESKITMKKSIMAAITMVMLYVFLLPVANAQSVEAITSAEIHKCQGGTELEGKIKFLITNSNQASTATVTVTLPANVKYVPGTITTKTTSTDGTFTSVAGITITETNITDLGAPVFRVTGIPTTNGFQDLVISLEKEAGCDASGSMFDTIVVAHGTAAVLTHSSDNYSVGEPVLSFASSPASISNGVSHTEYTREFAVRNTSVAAKRIYFKIDHNGASMKTSTISVKSTGVVIPPTYVQGSVYYYLLDATALGAALGQNQSVTIEEKIAFTGCSGGSVQTDYTMGIGSGAISETSSWCNGGQSIQSAVINLAGGSPQMISGVDHTNEISNYTSMGQSFSLTTTFTNSGTGNTQAATMYDVELFKGIAYSSSFWLSNYEWQFYKIESATIGGQTVTATASVADRGWKFDLKDTFTSGQLTGTGLQDIDGDGYVDDLPPGRTVTITITMRLDYSAIDKTAANCYSGFYGSSFGGQVRYTTMCGERKRLEKVLHPKYPPYDAVNPYSDSNKKLRFIERNIDNGIAPGVISGLTSANAPTDTNAAAPDASQDSKYFQVRLGLSGQTDLFYYFSNAHSRFQYVITLPDGLTYRKSTIKWRKRKYPNSSPLLSVPDSDISYDATTRVLKITGPDKYKGHVEMEMAYVCPATPVTQITLNYQLDYVDKPAPSEDRIEKLFCTSKTITVAGCATVSCASPSGEPSMETSLPIVERTTFGWTDATMATRVTKNDISAFNLKRAMHLDEIMLTATATQHTSTTVGTKSYARLVLPKTTAGDNKLIPIKAKYVYYDNSGNYLTTIETTGLPASTTTCTVSTNTDGDQQIDWEIPIPSLGVFAGTIPDGYQVRVESHYRVDLPNTTNIPDNQAGAIVQAGKSWSFFNKVGTNENSCNSYLPEMYLHETFWVNGTNTHFVYGCNVTNVGSALSRRFGNQGLKFENEFRPGMKVDHFEIEVPRGYKMIKVAKSNYPYPNDAQSPLTFISATSTSTSVTTPGAIVYRFEQAAGQFEAGEVKVTNHYNDGYRFTLKRTCPLPPSGSYPPFKNKFVVSDYYYATHDNPNNAEILKTYKAVRGIVQMQSPNFVASVSNPVIAYDSPGKYYEVVLSNGGSSQGEAPYTWLAIPNSTNVTIDKVTDNTGSTVIAPVSYTGGKMYHLDAAGLAIGETKSYRVYFSPTASAATIENFTMHAGWNCEAFPTEIDATCSKEDLNVTFDVGNSLFEIAWHPSSPNPTGGSNLCEGLSYVYHLSNTGKATLSNPTFILNLPQGMTVSGTFKVAYPYDPTNSSTASWQNAGSGSPLPSGPNTVYTYQLNTHTALTDFPGVFTESNVDNRTIGIKFEIATDCNFTSGNSFVMSSHATTAIGSQIEAFRSPLRTGRVTINGANTYTVNHGSIALTSAPIVGGIPTINGLCTTQQEVTSTHNFTYTGGQQITNDAYIGVAIPQNYKYVSGSFVETTGTPLGATFSDVVTLSPSNNKQIRIKLNAGGTTPTEFSYKFRIEEVATNTASCGTLKIESESFDTIGGISCATAPGGVCGSSTAITGNGELEFKVQKATLAFDSSSSVSSIVSATEESVTVTYTISNTSTVDVTQDLKVQLYYDVNSDGLITSADELLHTETVSTNITAGSMANLTFNTNVPTSKVCNTYLVINKSENGCVVCEDVVEKLSPPSTLEGIAGADQLLCEGDATKTIGLSNSAAYTYAWSSTDPSGTAYLSNANIGNPTFAYTGSKLTSQTSITYTLTATRVPGVGTGLACAATDTVVVTINPDTSVNAISNIDNVCVGSTVSVPNFTSTVAGTTFSWTSTNNNIGLTALSGNGNIGTFTATNATFSAISSIITVTPHLPTGCSGKQESFVITVNPLSRVQPISDVTDCNNVANSVSFTGLFPGTTFNWTSSNNIGFGFNGSGSTINYTPQNTGSAPISSTITVTPVVSGCSGLVETFTITVNPTPTVAAVADQTICSGSAITPVTFTGSSVAGTTYNWQVLGHPPYSGSNNIAPIVFTNTSTATISKTILVTPVANGCSGTPTSFTISIDPIPTVASVTDITMCNTEVGGAVTFTGTVSGTTYSWTSDVDLGFGTSGSGNIAAFTASNTGTTTLTANFEVTPKYNNCEGTPETFTINISPAPTVDTIANIEVCHQGSGDAINFTGPVTGTTYTWTSSVDIGFGLAGSGNIPTYTITTSGVATTTVTVTPSANGCTGSAKSFTITVKPLPTVNTVPDQTICSEDSTTAVTFTGTPATGVTYAWEIPGTTYSGTNVIPAMTLTNTTSSVVSQTVVVTPTAVGGCTGSPTSFTITVNPEPTVDTVTSTTHCNQASAAAIPFSGAVAGSVYSWTSDLDVGFGTTGSSTTSIGAYTASNTTSVPVTATITVTPSANGCIGSAKSFTITVNPTPTVNAITSSTYCNQASGAAIPFSGAVTGSVYSWTSDVNVGFGTTGSSTTSIGTFTATNATSVPVTATITVTPLANGCTGASTSFTITVNPTPTVNAIANATHCNQASAAAIPFGGAVTGSVYSWTSDLDVGFGTTGSSTTSIGAYTASNTTSVPVTATITVTPLANGCTGASTSFTITVNPTPTVNAITSSTYCNQASGAAIPFSGAVTGSVYSWTSDLNVGFGTTGSSTTSIGSYTASNTTSAPVTATITVTPLANGCTGASTSFTITVNPTPTVNAITSVTHCNQDAAAAIPFSGAVTGSVYSWTSDLDVGFGTTGSSTTSIGSYTASNTTSVPVTATITVTPSANGCIGSAKSFTITVNPTPTVNAITSSTYCNQASGAAISFTGAVTGSVYSWTSDVNVGFGTTGSSTTSIGTFTATNATSVPVTATITVTPLANGCTGASTSFTITVNPTPLVDPVPSNTVYCHNDEIPAVVYTGPVSGTTYSWTASINGSVVTSGVGGTPTVTAMNPTQNPIVTVIEVTPSANGCVGSSVSYTVTVNPLPIVTGPTSVYVGHMITLTGTATPTSWTASPTGIVSITGTGETVTITGTAIGTTTITYTNSNGCSKEHSMEASNAPLVANDDDFTSIDINGYVGNSNVGNILSNTYSGTDTLISSTATVSDVTISILTPAVAINGGNIPTIDVATGIVSVPAGTASGTYSIVYQLSEIVNAPNTASATVFLSVRPPVIYASNNHDGPYDSLEGGTVSSVLRDDTLNGAALIPSEFTFTPAVFAATSTGGITMNSDGTVTVSPKTPAGVYKSNYTICEVLNPTNCDSGEIQVTVVPEYIAANDDDLRSTPVISGQGKVGLGNVILNDKYGSTIVDATMYDVTVSVVQDHSNGAIVLDTTSGKVDVSTSATPGTYSLTYKICSIINPTNCDEAVVTVLVVQPGQLVASNDSLTVTDTSSASVIDVTANDTLNGAAVSSSDMNITLTNDGGVSGVSLDASGKLTIPSGQPVGTYTFGYSICEKINASNCDTAVVTYVVAEPQSPNTLAVGADSFESDEKGGDLGNVLSNDTFNGSALDAGQFNVSLTNDGGIGATLSDSGQLTLPSGVSPGTYSLEYKVCEKAYPSNCGTAVITLKVKDSTVPTNSIAVGSDSFNADDKGGTVGNVLSNDTFNGGSVDPSKVNLSLSDNGGISGASLDASGNLTLPAGVSEGTYTLKYTICDKLETDNCKTGEVTIVVTKSTPNKLEASADSFEVNKGGIAGNVIANDKLNDSSVSASAVNITLTDKDGIAGAEIDSSGNLKLPSDVSEGTYTLKYRICEKSNASNCSEAEIRVKVSAVFNVEEIAQGFSPNGDGINDTFVIPGLAAAYPNFEIKIFGRYGDVLYDYSNKGKTSPNWWDAIAKGAKKRVPVGIYFYVITNGDDGKTITEGWVYVNYRE